MSAIGISANLQSTSKQSIYRAQYGAVCLNSYVRSDSTNVTVQFIKQLPNGFEVPLGDLQGIFIGEGCSLLAQPSANCQIEITLMSKSAPHDYQVIYPNSGFSKYESEFTIDTGSCESCDTGSRVMKLSGQPGAQITLEVNVGASVTSDSIIKVYRWLKDPQCPPITEGNHVEAIAALPDNGGKFAITLSQTPIMLSFWAKNASDNGAYNLVCLTSSTSGSTITVNLETFPGSGGGGGGGY